MDKKELKNLLNINTQKKYGIKKEYAITLLVLFIFVVIDFINSIRGIINPHNADTRIKNIINLLIIIGTIYYGACGYKTPHGNLLKYLFLAFAFSQVLKIAVTMSTTIQALCVLAASVLIAYMAGRLDRIKENTNIIIVVTTLLVIAGLSVVTETGSFLLGKTLTAFEPLVIFVSCAAAYQVRYKLHKEAGLKDK